RQLEEPGVLGLVDARDGIEASREREVVEEGTWAHADVQHGTTVVRDQTESELQPLPVVIPVEPLPRTPAERLLVVGLVLLSNPLEQRISQLRQVAFSHVLTRDERVPQ